MDHATDIFNANGVESLSVAATQEPLRWVKVNNPTYAESVGSISDNHPSNPALHYFRNSLFPSVLATQQKC